MYKHILVPVDDGELSIGLVGHAVGLARAVGARVSFLHLLPGPNGRSAPERVDLSEGQVRELQQKSDAAARAAGVPSSSHCVLTDSPAVAIGEARQRMACDLIVVASHAGRARPGMAMGAETLDLLTHAAVPVLVLASTGATDASARAVELLRGEHRAMAAVLHAWTEHLDAAQASQSRPSISAMRDALHYLMVFADERHHPMESLHLFRLIRNRTSTLNAELDELDRQHERDHELLLNLQRQLDRLDSLMSKDAADPAWQDGLLVLLTKLRRYTEFVWDHLGREEGGVLPAAQQYLTEEDWQVLSEILLVGRNEYSGASTSMQAVLSQLRAAT